MLPVHPSCRTRAHLKKSIFSIEFDTYCKLLRTVRQEFGLGQHALAARLNTTQSWISKCERGERRLDAVELWRYCHAIGIPPEEFMRRLDAELSCLPEPESDSL